MMKLMQEMVYKDVIYKWDKKEKGAFSRIKKAIEKAPTLYSPHFNKGFFLYTFAFDSSLVAVVMKKYDQHNEWPISFMSSILQGHEINYPTIDKQAYIIYKAVKHFWPYLLKNHCVIFVLCPMVRSLFVQQELGEIREN